MLLTSLNASRHHFMHISQVSYHSLNSLRGISMTLKHVCQGELPCLGLEYREAEQERKRETTFSKLGEKKECGLDPLN